MPSCCIADTDMIPARPCRCPDLVAHPRARLPFDRPTSFSADNNISVREQDLHKHSYAVSVGVRSGLQSFLCFVNFLPRTCCIHGPTTNFTQNSGYTSWYPCSGDPRVGI